MTFGHHDRGESDAILTDSYLDALLAARDRRASDSPTRPELDPAVRFAAGRLSTDLARVHPSFRFEERLAVRLAEAAARMRLAAAVGDGGPRSTRPLELPGADPAADPSGETFDPGFDEPLDELLDASGVRMPRPLIIGSALTSAALSLAGAAYVAWRRSHPGFSPMSRAVRAVAGSRLPRQPAGLPEGLPTVVTTRRGAGTS